MNESQNKPLVVIYTDGACLGNPGPGGFAAILQYDTSERSEKIVSGAEAHTTNNRMELRAAIEGLAALKNPCAVTLFTDSQYVKNGITTWIHGWIKNGWRSSNKQPVKNQDLWEALLVQTKQHDIDWQWVRGHNGHPENERVDALAREACLNPSWRAP